MKRTLCFLLVLILTLALAACGGETQPSPSLSSPPPSPQTPSKAPESSEPPATSPSTPDTPEPPATPSPEPLRDPAAITEADVAHMFNINMFARAARLGDYYYYISIVDGHIYRVTLDGKDPKAIAQWTGSGYFNTVFAAGNVLYYLADDALYAYDPASETAKRVIPNVEPPFFIVDDRLYIGDRDVNKLLEFNMTERNMEILQIEDFDVTQRFAVLGDTLFYFTKEGAVAEFNSFFRVYDLRTGEYSAPYPDEHNYFESFGADEKYIYLQPNDVKDDAGESITLKIDRVTGEVTNLSRGGRSMVVMNDKLYSVAREGVTEYDETTGQTRVVAANAWWDGGLNWVDGYLFYTDTGDNTDALIKPDGTGKLVMPK